MPNPRPAVLAHLMLRLVSQRENFATEALAYVLNSSSAARAALLTRLRTDNPTLPAIAHVTTQNAARARLQTCRKVGGWGQVVLKACRCADST